MAVIALHTSATGLSALSTQLDVIANNLANVNTQGFKSSRVNFQDLMYIQRKQAGVENVNGDIRPIGLAVGLGVEVAGTQKNFSQGSIEPTGRDLDVAIEGRGFLQVSVDDETAEDGIAYTRFGALARDRDGRLVLATDEGRALVPEIEIDPTATRIDIGSDGTVTQFLGGGGEGEQVGQIELALFVNPAGLEEIGENLFLPTFGSGEPIPVLPGEEGAGTLLQGALESSNVEPVEELVGLIKTQRAFELNSQAIRAADETLQQINNLARR